ncbi:MAG TPA: hypothetical protein VFB30_09395, partial [Spirochaetia bacterium]|nr:hypothetical protein [Spirochaetia bacterium]
MDQSPAIVVIWTCVIVFVVTACLTIGGLLGWLVLGGEGGKNHGKYLNGLFKALILEVLACGVTIFYNYAHKGASNGGRGSAG